MSTWMRNRPRSPIAALVAIAGSVWLAACASGGAAPASQVRTSVHVEPPPAQATTAASSPAALTIDPGAPPSLPQLPGKQPALSAAPQQRISQIDVPSGTPIATAVAQLGAKLGLTVTVDPGVTGTAHASLHNVTIDEALHELVSRNGYAYQLQGNVLRVVPVRMETRTFPLDYVALSRTGTMSTVVQRRLSSAGGVQAGTSTGLSSFAGGPGAGGGGDVLTAQSVADIWQEIRVALIGIMGSGMRTTGTGAPGEQTAVNAPGQAPAGSFGTGATTVSFPDGSSLIISPISGLINVRAMPEKLAAVEQFINDFQGSILRQVLIEAKIVEVSLSNTFQFGLDWNVISASGRYGFNLTSDPSVTTTGTTGNVNFKLTGGSTQINAVLTALNTQGNVSVLSNEKTSALNNQRAIFQVTTDEIFFSVTRTPLLGPNGGVVSIQSTINPQQISVGVVLDVLAQISQDNILTMDIRPAVTNIDHIETISLSDGTTASAPVIARREGDTIARLRAGETMIIGGLVQSRKEKTVSGVPILKDLPFFGKLFQHINTTETRSELVIFLTPTIISGQPVTGR
ncbi:MAG: Type secretion system protein [Gemmatimonadetes bacterium]|nr:Type secretion system protein [Gemmatimonadota bacterium]